jgi:hypothetical protein
VARTKKEASSIKASRVAFKESFEVTSLHFHLVFNHFPVVGVIACLIPLLYGILRHDKRLVGVALFTISLFSLIVIPVVEAGEGAEDALKNVIAINELLSADDKQVMNVATTKDIIEKHEHFGELTQKSFLVTAGLGFIAIVSIFIIPSLSYFLSFLVVVSIGVSLLTATLAGQYGARIRHTELRREPLALMSFERYLP